MAITGDGIFIQVAGDVGDEVISHIGPGTTEAGNDTALSSATFSGDTITFTEKTLKFDALGHRSEAPSDAAATTLKVIVAPASPSNGDLLRYSGGVWAKVTPVTVNVVTDVQVTGVTLQKKTRDINVIPAGDGTDWVTFHTGQNQACE